MRQLLAAHQKLLTQWRLQALKQLSGRPWIHPQRPARASMAGAAFDTRVRWWLTGVDVIPDAVERGLALCHDPATQDRFRAAFAAIAGAPHGVLEPALEADVIRVAVAAASVEPLYRAGPVPCPLVELGWDDFLTEYADVVDDVTALSHGLPGLLDRYAGRDVVCGPVTTTGRLVGDADLVAGDELVEIKVVRDPRSKLTDALRQMLVYAARLRPSSMALLLPRQHTLVPFSLAPHAGLIADLDDQIVAAYAPVE